MEVRARERLGALEASHSYGYVLVLSLLGVVFAVSLPDDDVSRLLLVVFEGLTLITACWVSRVSRRVVAWAAGLTLVSVVLSLGATLGRGEPEAVTAALAALLILLTPVVMLRGLGESLREEGVTSRSILAALTIYTLIGVLFALVYSLVAYAGDGDLFGNGAGDGDLADRVYFAFTTQTTVGYGDFVPGPGVPRAISIFNGLVGQLYLVTVISLLIGNLGRGPRGARAKAAATADNREEPH